MTRKAPFDPRYHLLTSQHQEWPGHERGNLEGGNESSIESDLEIAQRLQQQFLDEKRKVEEDDLELAKRMHDEQQQEEFLRKSLHPAIGDENSFAFKNGGFEGQGLACLPSLPNEEDESLTLAKRLDMEEKENAAAHLGLRENFPNENHEEEDRKMALRVQEIDGSSSTSNNEIPAHVQTPEELAEEEFMRKMALRIQEMEDSDFGLMNEIPENSSTPDELNGEEFMRKLESRIEGMDGSGFDKNDEIPAHMLTPDESDEEEFMRKMLLQVQQQEDEELARNFQMQEDTPDDYAPIVDDPSIPNKLPSKPEITLKENNPTDENDLLPKSIPRPEQPTLKKTITKESSDRPNLEKKLPPKLTKKKKLNILSRFLQMKGKIRHSVKKEKEASHSLKPPSASPTVTPNSNTQMTSHPSSNPKRNVTCLPIPTRDPTICDVCGKPAHNFLVALGKKYHLDCFTCMGCCAPIKPTEPFAFTTNDAGEKFPLHQDCHAELYGMKCTVCRETIPFNEDGMITYMKHPFFTSEQMCPKHADDLARRCTGCNRFEPQHDNFLELNDAGRVLCNSCCRTVIMDSGEARPLWKKVINFFENKLKVTVWDGLREVPILIVGYDTLNSSMQNSNHSTSSQILTRGLCLSEHQSGRRIPLHNLHFDSYDRNFMQPEQNVNNGYTYFQVPDASEVNRDSSVTAILCLSGLPSDLTTSVLAHEATHAWFKLHPSFDVKKQIPPMVEEGCCQLVAHLFLSDGLEAASNENVNDSGPSDALLRQYFKFTIETDENEIYGTGFRIAAKVYASIGIEALLNHVALYREFPEI